MVEAMLKRLAALDDRLARLETQEAGAGAGTPLNTPGALVRRGSAGEIAVGAATVNGVFSATVPYLFGGRYIHGYPFNRITTFTNSWAAASLHGADSYVAWHQDATGKVFLTGTISGGVNGNSAFTLPASQRPSTTEIFCIATSGGIGRLDINAAGSVTPVGGSGTYYLDGISFYPSAYDSLFTAVTFTNSWVNYDAGYMQCAHYVDPLGRVHVRGLMKSGTVGSSAFTLPSGSRPWRNSVSVSVSNAAFGRLDYNSSGTVVPVSGSNTWFSLSGLMFPNSDVAPEAAWMPLEQQGFWQDYDAVNWPMIAAWVDATGRVHLNGITNNGTINTTAHLLPPGARPPRKLYFPAASNGAYGRLELNPASAIVPAVGSNTWFSYAGAHFLPAN